MRLAKICAAAWVVFVGALVIGLLVFFPWHMPGEDGPVGDTQAILKRLGVGLTPAEEAQLSQKDRADYEAMKKLYLQVLGENETSAWTNFWNEFKAYRRMPVWTAPKEELVAGTVTTPAGGGRVNVQVKMNFEKPVRAVDRFVLELVYGIGLAALVQVVVLAVVAIGRRRRRAAATPAQ